MSELHVFSNGFDWLVAESIDDAWKVWEEYSGEPRADCEGNDSFIQVPDDKPISITFEDSADALPLLAAFVVDGGDDDEKPVKIAMTAAEWCQHSGRGFLCSTEF